MMKVFELIVKGLGACILLATAIINPDTALIKLFTEIIKATSQPEE
ncbi:MAG: hypothetical protein FWF59_09185 [Turicibacter sp.]|nr:hypothetical protein [Turicibacter sp.]